ncbi:MAG: hypothetical protein U0V56_04370 [Actinomycetota bacterium]
MSMLSPLVRAAAGRAIEHRSARWASQGSAGPRERDAEPRRTSSTASALMIGLGLVAMVAILSASLKVISFDRRPLRTLKGGLHPLDELVHPVQPRRRGQQVVDGVAAVAQFRQGGVPVNEPDVVPN